MKRVFVVTGSNKGIGKCIVKRLLQENTECIVYLTSRNEVSGHQAIADLRSIGLNPNYHQLDISSLKSVEEFRNHLVERYNGFDVLVNNAGIAFHRSSNLSYSLQAKQTMECNYFGTELVCDTLFPILKVNGRVCNVSSLSWELAFNKLSNEMKQRLLSPYITIEELSQLMSEYVLLCDTNDPTKVDKAGWSKSVYGVSKIGVSILTRLQQRMLDEEYPGKNILCNSCCPGMAKTDMSNGNRENEITPEEAADTPVYLASLPSHVNHPKASYVKLRKVVDFP